MKLTITWNVEPRSAIARSVLLHMGINQRFKFIRALPTTTNGSQPDYFSYTLASMKQIPTQLLTAIADGNNDPIVHVFIPKSSWAQNKLLLIRGCYTYTAPVMPAPPLNNVSEFVFVTNGAPAVMLIPGAPASVAGSYTTYFERCLIRVDPNILVFDRGDVMQFNFANDYDNIHHVIAVAPIVAPFDYSIPIDVTIDMNIPVTMPGATITAVWAEAFLEQATNLGKLP